MAKIYKNLEIMAHNFKLMKHYLLILKGQLTFFGKYFWISRCLQKGLCGKNEKHRS